MKDHKNYLEHEENVRAMDGCFSRSQDWDWFINTVENSFDLDDVKTWRSFLERRENLASVYRLLIHIRRVSDCKLHPSFSVLEDLITIADYFNGKIGWKQCRPSTVFGKTLFLTVWIAKLLNADNHTDNIYNAKILTVKNFWNLERIDSILQKKDELMKFADQLQLSDWQLPLACFKDNLNLVQYSYSIDFFSRYGDNLLQANTFSWQHISIDEGLTWEEQFLLEMIGTSIETEGLQPMFKSSSGSYPDLNSWTEERIEHMVSFFNHPAATFILESVRYLLYGKSPSNETIRIHAELWTTYSKCHESYETFSCSSFRILERLIKEKKVNIAEYGDFRERVQSFTSPEDLMKLGTFPLSKQQRETLRQYSTRLYQSVAEVVDTSDLLDFLRKSEVQKYINNEYLAITAKKFRVVAEREQRALATLFHEYMCFLFKTKWYNTEVNRDWIEKEMIDTQILWQEKYYKIQLDTMKMFESSVQIERRQIEELREAVHRSPLSFAALVMTMADNEKLCQTMASISENPVSLLFTRFIISEVFPMPDKLIMERHDVDQLMVEHVKSNLEQYGYRYLNQMEPEQYVHALIAGMNQRICHMASLLETTVLYEDVRQNCLRFDYELIAYQNPLKPGHLTQLFPYLETRIRELAKLSMVFPFKENLNEFMQYKDPSSILREIIEMIYGETESFELIPDILFVYYSMYNGNGLNIRNESVHGRANLQDPEQAIKITCLAILMIEQRIKLIEKNMS